MFVSGYAREVLRKVLSLIEDIDEVVERDVRLLREETEKLGDWFFLLVVAGEHNFSLSLTREATITEKPALHFLSNSDCASPEETTAAAVDIDYRKIHVLN
eukprot:IDg4875t1